MIPSEADRLTAIRTRRPLHGYRHFTDRAEPAVLLTVEERDWLLAHLEAVERRVDFLKGALAQLAHFNPDWDMLQATRESLNEHMKSRGEAEAERDRLAAEVTRLTQERNALIASGDDPAVP